ncbi:hypothetical protein Tco_0919857 [Tanacetum coccineum]
MGRLTWAHIAGLQIVRRHHGAVKSIVKVLGRVLEIDRRDLKSKLIMPVKVLMLVYVMGDINRSLLISLNEEYSSPTMMDVDGGDKAFTGIFSPRTPGTKKVSNNISRCKEDNILNWDRLKGDIINNEVGNVSSLINKGNESSCPSICFESPRTSGLPPPLVLDSNSAHYFMDDSFWPLKVMGYNGSASQYSDSPMHDGPYLNVMLEQ